VMERPSGRTSPRLRALRRVSRDRAGAPGGNYGGEVLAAEAGGFQLGVQGEFGAGGLPVAAG
jgi:hypothetical protein